MGVLFAGDVALMALSPEFLWLAFPLWLLAASSLTLVVALLLIAVTLAVIVTVKTHLVHAFTKLDADSRTAAVAAARRHGLLA